MMTKEERIKTENKHLLLTIYDGPDLRRGRPTKRLKEMWAAIPLAQEYAEKCGGMLSSINFNKFMGTVCIDLPGSIDSLNRTLEEFRLLVETADKMHIDRYDIGTEIRFIFYDIYEVAGTETVTGPAIPQRLKTRKI